MALPLRASHEDLAGPDLDKAARQASQREAAAGAAGGGAGGGGRRQVASRLRASVMSPGEGVKGSACLGFSIEDT